MIDAHIHYVKSLNPDKLKAMTEKLGLTGIALQCIPGPDNLPVEEDAFSFRRISNVPVYIFGGIRRAIYQSPERELSEALVEEAKRIMESGCEGIKMLEGKTQIRKAHPIPDFDLPVWEPFWTYMEKERIPIFFHVNDPEEFWDVDKISKHALECGWLYDETFINNEEQYRQVMEVLKRHPKLRVVFPHFFFLSQQLERLDRILTEASEVRIDITPGIELYYNLSKQQEKAKSFFDKYQDRILYGTDTGARQVVKGEGEELSLSEAISRSSLIWRFLETKGDYAMPADGEYVTESCDCMHGLGLSEKVLEKIYEKNFLGLLCR